MTNPFQNEIQKPKLENRKWKELRRSGVGAVGSQLIAGGVHRFARL
jgi:hypothetical protein